MLPRMFSTRCSHCAHTHLFLDDEDPAKSHEIQSVLHSDLGDEHALCFVSSIDGCIAQVIPRFHSCHPPEYHLHGLL